MGIWFWALRWLVFLLIIFAVFVSAARGIGLQIPVKLAALKADLIQPAYDRDLHIYLIENAGGLRVDLTNRPCFRSLVRNGGITNVAQQLWVARDNQGIFIMDSVGLAKCHFLDLQLD